MAVRMCGVNGKCWNKEKVRDREMVEEKKSQVEKRKLEDDGRGMQ